MANEFYRQRVGQHLEIGLKALEKLKAQEWARLHSRKLRSFAEVAFQYYFWSRLSATKSKQFYAALLDRMMTEHPDLLTSAHKSTQMIEPHIIGKMGQRAAEAQVTKLFAEQEIAIRVEELARMAMDRLPSDLVIVGFLVGSFVFVADLIRALHRLGGNPGVEFIRLSSYGLGRESSGTPRLIGETELDLAGRAVLLVDDIVDTGRTLLYARDLLRRKKAATVLTCALVDKPSRREVAVNPDFVGFTVPDAFIVGYGIDYAHQFRQLPFIGMIK